MIEAVIVSLAFPVLVYLAATRFSGRRHSGPFNAGLEVKARTTIYRTPLLVFLLSFVAIEPSVLLVLVSTTNSFAFLLVLLMAVLGVFA